MVPALWWAMVAASVLPAAWAAELVVDQKHPAAADTNPGTPAAPFRTINKAVSALKPGDTVLVHGGLYRESVTVTTSGTADRPITLKAAPGERAIITGAEPVAGWKRCTPADLPGHANPGSIYYVDLPQSPVHLYFRGVPADLRVAHWPRGIPSEGRIASGYHGPTDAYPVEDGDERRIVDAAHLTQPAGAWEGGDAIVVHFTVLGGRFQGDSTMYSRIVGYDAAKHELRVDPPFSRSLGKAARGEHRQWYRVQNLPGLIAEPGEYACRPNGEGVRFYLRPTEGVDPAKDPVEGSFRQHGLVGEKVSHVRFEGFEVARTTGTGISFQGGSDNRIERCVAYYCRMGPRMEAAAGISLGAERNSVVRHCLSILNGYGIMQAHCQDTLVEGCVSGRHIVDGLVVSWHSKGVRLLRNYVFDCWDLGHPDGFQTYRDVQKLVVDSNLFLSIGQGWQCAETQDAVVTNNIWAGVHYANCISCSLRDPVVGDVNRRNRFSNNLFFGGSVGTGGESIFTANIALPPSGGGTSDQRGISGKPVQSDYNLLWCQGKPPDPMRDFDAWKEKTGRNQHSLFAPPRFRCGPLFETAAAEAQTAQGRLTLDHGTDGFEVGDLVEIDLDGVKRTVKAVDGGALLLDPPVERVRGTLTVVWNWKKNGNFDGLDLRLADDSPGKGLAPDGKDPGSTIDVQATMRGDFDADGRRDSPDIPQELKAVEPRLARFLKW